VALYIFPSLCLTILLVFNIVEGTDNDDVSAVEGGLRELVALRSLDASYEFGKSMGRRRECVVA
jgi:hypothetical protein